MTDIPDPPAGSSVRKEPHPEGVRLSWPGHSRAKGTMLAIAFALAVVALVAGVLIGAMLFRKGTPYEGAKYAVVAGFLVAASFLSTVLAVRLRSLFREGVALGPDELLWTPPASASEMSGHFGWSGGESMLGHSSRVAQGLFRTAFEGLVLWREREVIRIPRSGITDFRLEGRGRFEHLTISVGKTDIDIAKRVGHDDREWLLALLRRWRDAPD